MRLYIAYLLAGIPPDIILYPAAGLVIYSTYTLDRALGSKEDEVNNSDYRSARREIGIYVSVITFMFGAGLFVLRNAYLAPFIPFFVGFFYSKGICLRNRKFRLKGSLGGKNLVIGLIWGGTIAIVIARDTSDLMVVVMVFLFYFGKLFFNSAVYDMKDAKGDMQAGIRTLPVVLGDRNTRFILAVVCLLIHILAAGCMLAGVLRPEMVILGISALSASVILLFYTEGLERSVSWIKRHIRILLIDCEAPLAIVFRQVIMA